MPKYRKGPQQHNVTIPAPPKEKKSRFQANGKRIAANVVRLRSYGSNFLNDTSAVDQGRRGFPILVNLHQILMISGKLLFIHFCRFYVSVGMILIG